MGQWSRRVPFAVNVVLALVCGVFLTIVSTPEVVERKVRDELNDWVGYGYAVWLLLLVAPLSDLALNRGRILARLLVHLPGALAPPT